MREIPTHESSVDLDRFDELLVVRPRRRAEPDTQMDITPMIDITFLLLIFFLVSSRIAEQASVALPPAQSGDAISARQSVIITVDEVGDGDAEIYKGDGVALDTRLAATDLLAQEQELADYVRTQLAASPGKRYVMIKAAKGVKHKHVARISHAVGKVDGVERYYVAVLETE